MSVTGGSQDLEDTLVDRQERDIERSSSQVVDDDLVLALGPVEAVGNRCGCGFVDDSENVETGNRTGILGGLTLGVIEAVWARLEGQYSDRNG
jgi:hypothetical protein